MRKFIDIVSPISRLDEAKAFKTMMVATQAAVEELYQNYDANTGRRPKNLLDAGMKHADTLRQDRAVWLLREVRIATLNMLAYTVTNVYPQETEGWQAYKAKVAKLAQKANLDYIRQTGKEHNDITPVATIISNMEHFKGVPYSKLQTYVFTMEKDWAGIKADLHEIENEFIERARGKVTMKEGDKVIVSLPDNYAWVMLNRANCRDEANAMGHCGNSPRSHTKDKVLSLRKMEEVIDGIQYMTPCLTFILEADGYLSEMKGRGNQKPAEHYHDAIEALLRSEHIKGIRGGGYEVVERGLVNFSVNDMDHDRAEALVAHNPKLLTPVETYQRYGLGPQTVDAIRALKKGKFWTDFMKALEEFKLKDADRQELFRSNPDLVPLVSKYKRDGLSDEVIEELRWCYQNSKYDLISGFDYQTGRYKRGVFDLAKCGTYGLKFEDMREEDQHRLIQEVPEAATPADKYKFEGLTDDLIFTILDGLWERGPVYFKRWGIDWTSWPEEDKEKLFSTDWRELLKARGEELVINTGYNDINRIVATPQMLAPFTWALQQGWDEDVLEEKLDFAIEYWGGGSIYDTPKRDENGFWELVQWSDCIEMAEMLGKDAEGRDKDALKTALETAQDGHDQWPDNDDWHVENFDDDLPVQTLLALRQYAKMLKGETEPDEDEDEDYEDDGELDSWKQILEFIDEEDDDLMNNIKSAVEHGYRVGSENDASESVQSFLSGMKPDFGQLIFTRHDEYIDTQSPVRFGFDDAELARCMDTHFDDSSNLEPNEFLKVTDYNSPYHGFQGYDGETAADSFRESDLPDELEALLEYTPFRQHVADEQARFAALSEKELRALIEEIATKGEQWHGWSWKRPADDADLEALRKNFLDLSKKYWG